jgi:preprotein translocase subunit SecA
MSELERKEAYLSDITYGTNNEFGFDYLRDNMKYSLKEKVQREHNFVIVDEVDSILIDEARTPLIISGPTSRTLENYSKAHKVAIQLEKGEVKAGKEPNEEITTGDFSVDEKNRVILLTEDGISKAEELFEVDNLYSLENSILAHHLDQALKANYLFEKDVDYVVQDNEVIIVDEFTGRLSEGRRFSEGLHQALEAKEDVKIQEESQTLADITFQNYFRMYNKLAGMTGTAQTEATEFAEIYSLDVVSIPTNIPVARKDLDDLIYKSEREKFEAVIKKTQELYEKGQPVLIGTASIEKSELLHKLLKNAKIPHTVLNAKQHAKEAEIIINAGKKGAVTIATNMAGRGVDIKISDEIKELGGLYIIGTERHESRRIDNQLRGRSGRQGDSGVSQFYLSLEDSLLRIFGSDKIKTIMERLGIEEGEHIESRMVTRAVENAQKKVENLHFESRKHLLEYDDVANEQRKVVYNFRNDLLNEDYDITKKLNENRREYVEYLLSSSEIFEDIASEDFNIDRLTALIKEDLNGTTFDLSLDDFETLKTSIYQNITDTFEEKMSQLEEKQRSEIERIIYLQILDNSWREHLYQMDTLKTGIGLRGYNQKDPLVEYKKESYNLFMDFIASIKNEITKVLFNFKISTPQEEEEERRGVEEALRAKAKVSTESRNESSNQISASTKKVPRNSPCPCGSGKKYKQCCGQSGPKKGLLAK